MKNCIGNIFQPAGINRIMLLGGMVLIFLLTIGMASAAGPSISTDKADYGPDDLVTITGTGFTPGATITLQIAVPDGSGTTDTTEVTADSDGNFVLTYQLIDGIQDNYIVTGTEGINTATTSFTDNGGTIVQQFIGGLNRLLNRIGGQFLALLPLNTGTSPVPNQGAQNSEIPEFPTVALPVAAVIGLVFFFQYKKGKI